MMHTKKDIDDFLSSAFFSVLTFPSINGLFSQLMIFSHTVDGNFYLFSKNKKELFQPLSENLDVSILIYKEEKNLDDICQTTALGKASLLEDMESDEVKLAYETLGIKSPLIGNIPIDNNNQPPHTLVKVEVTEISYITFAEINQQADPTILKRE